MIPTFSAFPTRRCSVLSLGLMLALGCGGTSPDAPEAGAGQEVVYDLIPDMVTQTRIAEEKIVALARAIPEAQYPWRPADGVRSVSEVLIHVAADNYFIPALMGVTPPAVSGVTDDYATVLEYQGRDIPKDQIVSELEASFRFLYEAIDETSPDMERSFDFAGTTYQVGPMWVQAVTHLHEHLGQGIAYARSTGVTPPWSR